MSVDVNVREALWTSTPDWTCPNCRFVNMAIRELCRNCGYDSNAGEFPYYDPMPPYSGMEHCGERPDSAEQAPPAASPNEKETSK